jgi:predicted lipoprotein with Yx(FWY)xxD motif
MPMNRTALVSLFAACAAIFGVFAAAVFLSGGTDSALADSSRKGDARPASASSEPAAARPAGTIAVGESDYGQIVFDTRGFTLYAFTRDGRGPSRCSGACAEAWPPYVAEGELRAGPGTRQGLLATVRRPDGSRQVTYDGRPLYYYVGDREPGQVLCQDVVEFGGTWLVVRGGGALVQ